ncbi:uncharacterized protein OCT59_001182 [Rhizophagus irregularis]|uniref:uncharacterized protein n=1 Tax=Rhizophagus irregularis TaxID=588596 RepID=UPI00332588EC|nr:hypothetical protein OCT59_001182 [Rhizophagus irregularis]
MDQQIKRKLLADNEENRDSLIVILLSTNQINDVSGISIIQYVELSEKKNLGLEQMNVSSLEADGSKIYDFIL